ncbi:MAG: phosphatidylinositol mannoside acyltransferase [Nocardioidaceae bacterium]
MVARGYLLAWRLARFLPEPWAQWLFARIADVLCWRNGEGVRRLRANLEAIGPVDDALLRQATRSYLRYWCEAFRLPAWPIGDLVSRTRVENEALVRREFGSGGAVLALPHMANWDWAGAWATATGMPVVSVAERLEPETIYERFVTYRRSIGIEILPLDGPHTIAELLRALRHGRLICLLCDRDIAGTGVEVELLGRRARMAQGPAVLAQRTGAALLPVTARYEGHELVLTVHERVEPADPATMMQSVADVFSQAIRHSPQDWHMMQRVFL